MGPSKPAFSQARRLFRSVEAPRAPMPQRQTMTLAMTLAAPVRLNMMPLNTTWPIMMTSTTRMAVSPLLKMADTSRPVALEANSMSSTVTKSSRLVSKSRWFWGMCTTFTNPTVRMAAWTISMSSSTKALLSTTAGRLTPTDASRRMISRSLQISR